MSAAKEEEKVPAKGAGSFNTNKDEPKYYFKDGLRFVQQYDHAFSCHAKRRWIGQKLLQIYSQEFKAFSSDYYAKAMTNWKDKDADFKGKITVNKKNVDLDYQIKDGDFIIH